MTVAIDFLTYSGLLRIGAMGVDTAKATSFLLGTAFAYFANRFWTFGRNTHAAGSHWRFIVLYTAALGANVLINAMVLALLDETAMAVQIAFLCATGVSAALNFGGMKLFVFKAQKISGAP